MFTVTEAISIARSREDVFDFLTDGRNRPQWDATVIFEELTSPAPVGVGSTIHTRMRTMGREADFHWRVTEFDPPNRMAIVSTAGLMPTSLVFEFATTGAECAVSAAIEARPGGMLRLVEPLIAESVGSTLGAGLAKAKALLERQALD